MLTQDSCVTTQYHGHGNVWYRVLLRAMSGFMALLGLESEFTSMAPVTTEGWAEACSLGQPLKPW